MILSSGPYLEVETPMESKQAGFSPGKHNGRPEGPRPVLILDRRRPHPGPGQRQAGKKPQLHPQDPPQVLFRWGREVRPNHPCVSIRRRPLDRGGLRREL